QLPSPPRLHFFFTDTSTTDIYTLSLHDALPISTRSSATSRRSVPRCLTPRCTSAPASTRRRHGDRSSPRSSTTSPPRSDVTHVEDRKSTRLNSSHVEISYAVFCLKKKKKRKRNG